MTLETHTVTTTRGYHMIQEKRSGGCQEKKEGCHKDPRKREEG